MKQVIEYEIVDHGPDNSSYFPGCGVAFTRYDDEAVDHGEDWHCNVPTRRVI